MFKKKEGDTNADAMDNFNKMFGFDVPERVIPKEEPMSDNPHIYMVQYVLRATKAEKAMELFNDVIKPLPDTA